MEPAKPTPHNVALQLGSGFEPSAPPFEGFELPDLHSSTLQPQPEANPYIPLIYPTFTNTPELKINDFFTNPEEAQLYGYNLSEETNWIDGLEQDINDMRNYLTESGFQPYVTDENRNSRIHIFLQIACTKFAIKKFENENKRNILFAEQFIHQFLSQVIRIHGNSDASFSKKPFFVCLEIALRVHLFNIIIHEEKYELGSIFNSGGEKFPDDLKDREDALEALITRNGFFKNPEPTFFHNLLPNLSPHIDSCVSKCVQIDQAENLIRGTLTELNLTKPSRTSFALRYRLIESMAQAHLNKQIQRFKDQFQKTGAIKLEDFNHATGEIFNILAKNGVPLRNAIKQNLLVGIFELRQDFDLGTLRTQLEKQKPKQSGKSLFSWLSGSPKPSPEICKRLDQQLATVAWAEREWNAFFSPEATAPTAPPAIEPERSLVILRFETPPQPPVEAPIILDSEVPAQPPVEAPVQDPVISSVEVPAQPPVEAPPILNFEAPAVRPLRAQMPLPAPTPEPAKPEPVKIYATDFNIPLVSYIHIACAGHFRAAGDDWAIWNSLSPLVQRDALRHVCYLHGFTGKAEEIALRLFKTFSEIKNQLGPLENIPPARARLSAEFIEKGEALLKMYYSPNRDKFYDEFRSLPRENLFYQYVYEMAKAAGVHIESWDHHFAENNWHKITMTNLSVQALERCLHTDS